MDATKSDLLVMDSISTCFGHLYAHHQEIRLRSTAYSCLSCCSCCDAGELGRKMCALCGECCLTTVRQQFPHSAQYSTIFWKKVLNVKCVSEFLYNFRLKHFSFLEEFGAILS